MSQEELNFRDWIAKINERLTFLLLNIKDKRDITENDYDILRVFYKTWYNGEHPLYATKMEGVCQTVTQANLFSGELSATIEPISYGTDVVVDESEPIN
jgi:hypothetical protein